MTRKKLIEFLYPHIYGEQLREDIADALIKEGFVKVDEPKEVYKCIHCGVFLNPGEIHTAHGVINKYDLIRFREVVEE